MGMIMTILLAVLGSFVGGLMAESFEGGIDH